MTFALFFSSLIPTSSPVMNKEVGKAYRDSVLRPGGSKDGMDLLIDFLGRKPDTAPFLKSLGFEQPAKSTL